MELPAISDFQAYFHDARITPRIIRDLRYVPSEITHPESRDFLAVMTKSRNDGVLLFQDVVYPFSLSKKSAISSGRLEGVICDICASWQRGTNAARITLQKTDKTSVSYLVCADLDCSLHVRDLTSASKLSRAQLREHISPDKRVERLLNNLTQMLK